MSDTNINVDAILRERDSLLAQLTQMRENGQQQIEGLQNQIQAVDETLQDAMRMNIGLRTNIKMFQKENQKLNSKITAHEQTIAKLNNDLSALSVKLSEVQSKDVQPDVAA